MQKKIEKRIRLKKKIRAQMSGDSLCPRLSVFRSNKFIYAQIIDDTKNITLAQASDVKMKEGTKMKRAEHVGRAVAEECKKININKVVFDRNGFRYTGRIKLVADMAREAGLKF